MNSIYKSKIIIICVLLCSVFFNRITFADNSSSDGGATFLELYVDRNYIKTDGKTSKLDVAPFIYDNRMFVPLRGIMEAFGYDVSWNQGTQEISIKNDEIQLYMHTNENNINVVRNGISNYIKMDVTPLINNNRTMIPIRFIADALGYEVFWEDTQQKTTIASMGWGAKKIGIDKMKNYLEKTGKNDNGSVIAVIDTGVDRNHIYLKNRIVNAYNVINGSDNVSDMTGHGTHVAGIIANCIPQNVKIMPIKIQDDNGVYSPDAIAEGIQYAVSRGAKVINISLQKSVINHNNEIENAINSAVRSNCVVVVAAGNEEGDTADYTPSCIENAIVVTAIDKNGEVYTRANKGDTVTVAAPGVGISSCINNNTFDLKDGTSMAAPYVSAAVAMIMMDMTEISPKEIQNLLIRYSEDRGAQGLDPVYGGGIIDLNQYVSNRKSGIIDDFTRSVQEKSQQLDDEIKEIRERMTKEHVESFGVFLKDFFARELNNQGVRRYNMNDYFASGYFMENAILNGDCDHSLAKNNLAYLLRRGEYVSSRYELKWLLSYSQADGQPLAYINKALLEASKNNWEAADTIIKEFRQDDRNCDGVITTWKALSYNDDVEGDLVLGWLMRYRLYEDSHISQKEYLDKALKKFPTIPPWMYEEVLEE